VEAPGGVAPPNATPPCGRGPSTRAGRQAVPKREFATARRTRQAFSAFPHSATDCPPLLHAEQRQQEKPLSEKIGAWNARKNNGSGGGIRTHDLWVMSPTSCRCSTPRHRRKTGEGGDEGVQASGCRRGCRARGPHFPGSCPPSTPPALAGGTTGFGMGPGGAPPRSLTPGTPAATVRNLLAAKKGITMTIA